MSYLKRALVFVAIAALVAGCARLKAATSRQPEIPETAADLQDINLNMINEMMENLDTEIAAVKQVPAGTHPLYEELRATDLAGMEARKALLVMLAEHCRFAKEKLLEAEKYPERKQKILGEWSDHRKQMTVSLDAADRKVNELERKRVRLEFDLVQAALEKD